MKSQHRSSMPDLELCFNKKKMSKIILFIVYGLFFGTFPSGKPGVNYEHKLLFRELEKTWEMSSPVLHELEISGELKRDHAIQGKFFRVNDPSSERKPNYIYIGRVNSCRAGGCSISLDPSFNADSEYFDYFILFDSTMAVNRVRVFNYEATHGQEVSAKGWLRQFNGFNGSAPLVVGKNIDAISGATISVYGITLDIEMKTGLLHQLVNEG